MCAHARSIEIERIGWRSNVVRRRPPHHFSSANFTLNIAAVHRLRFCCRHLLYCAYTSHPSYTPSSTHNYPLNVFQSSVAFASGKEIIFIMHRFDTRAEETYTRYVRACVCVCVHRIGEGRLRNAKSKIERKNEKINKYRLSGACL